MSIDPNVPGIFFGEVTAVNVIEPPPLIPGAVGNFVIDPTREFTLQVEWFIDGPFAPAMKAAMGATWQLRVFSERQGPNADSLLVNTFVPTSSGVDAGTRTTWTVNHVIPANTLADQAAVKLLVVVRDSIPGPVDVAGYHEGPLLLTETP